MLDEEKDASAESEDALSDMELAMLIAAASALVSAPIAHKAIRKSGRALLAKLQQIAGANRESVNEAIDHDFRGSFIRNWLADVEDAGKVTPKAASLAAKRAQQRARKPIASVQRYAAKMSQQMAQSAYMEYLKIASEAAFASTGNIDDPGVGYERALSAGIAKMARKGLTASTYTRKDGTVVHVPVDVGIRRAIAAEGREPKIKATLDAADSSFGLVEVSKTVNPRDTHHRWEGRVYSTGASIAGFPSFEDVVGDQINDYNCGHRIRVFNPNTGRRFSDPLEGTGYTAEQSAALHTEQAKLENDIRKLKREHEVLHSLSLETKDVNRRLKAKRAELDSLLNDHPKILSRREWREYTYEKARRELGLYGKVHIDKSKQLYMHLEQAKRKAAKNGIGVKVAIDEKTPCLRRLSDGKIVSTGFEQVHPRRGDYAGWEFDWTKPEKEGNTVLALKASGDSRTQGLLAYRETDYQSVYVALVEAAPHNNKHNTTVEGKEYNGVGAHLFAEAVKKSYELGYNGFVDFTAKNNLVDYYKKLLGAQQIDRQHMYIDERAAAKLYERYYGNND